MAGHIHVKRVRDPASEADGARVLVDRLWPRGVSREAAALSSWLKEIAPTTGLRQWFGHDPARWDEFRERYRAELDANPEAVATLRRLLDQGDVTLLHDAHDRAHNQALVLADYLRDKAGQSARGPDRPGG